MQNLDRVSMFPDHGRDVRRIHAAASSHPFPTGSGGTVRDAAERTAIYATLEANALGLFGTEQYGARLAATLYKTAALPLC
jgi:hypothetical protein